MLRNLLRRITTSSYPLRREYLLARSAVLSLGRRPLLVYQMGKVGSTSVAGALAETATGRQVLQFHTLREERLEREEQVYRERFPQRRRIDAHLLHSLYVKRRLSLPWPRARRWQVVTLVRDPVARNLSTFFQTLDLHFRHLGFSDRIRAGDERVVDDLLAYFVARFPHDEALTWFDDEIRSFFGIDLLAEPFPHDEGFKIYRGDAAQVLLLRLEDLDRCGSRAFERFLGIPALDLGARNVGGRKYYAEAYRQARQRLVLPEELLDRIYGSRLVRILYTEDEIRRRRDRWSRP